MTRKFFPPDVWETMMKVITSAVEREHSEWRALGFDIRIITAESIAPRIAGEKVFSKLSKRQVAATVERALPIVKKRNQYRTPEKPEGVSASGILPANDLDLSHASIEDLVEEVARRMKSDLPIKRSFQIVEQLSLVRDAKADSIRREMASLQEQEACLCEEATRHRHDSNGAKPHQPIGPELMVCHSSD